MGYSRRAFSGMAVAALAEAAALRRTVWAADSRAGGVRLGLITGSLGRITAEPGQDVIDLVISGCQQVGVRYIELVNLLEPRLEGAVNYGHPPSPMTPEYEKSRQAVREWRLSTPVSRFTEVRTKFDRAGLTLVSYVMTFDMDFTDAEIEAVFRQMQALKVKFFCTNQSRMDVAPRLIPYAERFRISPAWHPHSNVTDPNEVGSVASLEQLLAMSRYFKVNLDLGHFTAGNNDAVAFLRKHHERITHVHVKDRKRDNGPNVELGSGDTPIKEALTLIRDRHWPIYAIIEREYLPDNTTPIEETKKQLQYCESILQA